MTSTKKTGTSRSPRSTKVLRAVGLWGGAALLVVWAIWWGLSFNEFSFYQRERFGFPAWHSLGLDFFHNYGAAIMWMNGGNPFHSDFGDPRGTFGYSPVVLPAFFWSVAAGFETATFIWFVMSVAVLGLAVYVVTKYRQEQRRADIPWPLTAALLLWSMPVLFSLERGQCDELPLLMICLTFLVLRRQTWQNDILAALMIGYATWVKAYPGLLIPGLAVIGRFRTSALSLAAVVVFGGASFLIVPDWLSTAGTTQKDRVGALSETMAWLKGQPVKPTEMTIEANYTTFLHSLTTLFPSVLKAVHLDKLATVPGFLLSLGLCTTIIGLVSWGLWKSPRRSDLAFPFMMWLCLMGTFVIPISYDYNLIYVPLLLLALLPSLRGRTLTWMLVLVCLPWLQPFALLQSVELVVVMKAVPIFLMGWVIVAEARQPLPEPA